MASSSTTTRTPRIGRWPRPTPCARWRTPVSPRPSRGRSSPRASRATSRCARCRRASPPSATGTQPSTAAREEAEGLGDAPWPPHYAKQAGEPPRVQPSRRKAAAQRGRRAPAKPLVEIGRAARREDALAGLARWKDRHPEAAAHLAPADVLVDAMRGRSSTWTRVRVNLEHVPPALRPAQGPLDPDYDPFRRRPPRARRTS
jgi:hypothetical protein